MAKTYKFSELSDRAKAVAAYELMRHELSQRPFDIDFEEGDDDIEGYFDSCVDNDDEIRYEENGSRAEGFWFPEDPDYPEEGDEGYEGDDGGEEDDEQ